MTDVMEMKRGQVSDGGKESKKPAPPPVQKVQVSAPNFQRAVIAIKGVSPYVSNKFSTRQQQAMRAKQEEGSSARNRKARQPKDFEALWKETMHVSRENWYGIPASAFRNALISACRVTELKMTLAKLSIFVVADGYDKDTGEPLVKIEGKPHRFEAAVRLSMSTTDICARAQWDEWKARVTIRWDADQFAAIDIVNLMTRVGMQVGIGAGRPDSKTSCGMGWGVFEVVQ